MKVVRCQVSVFKVRRQHVPRRWTSVPEGLNSARQHCGSRDITSECPDMVDKQSTAGVLPSRHLNTSKEDPVGTLVRYSISPLSYLCVQGQTCCYSEDPLQLVRRILWCSDKQTAAIVDETCVRPYLLVASVVHCRHLLLLLLLLLLFKMYVITVTLSRTKRCSGNVNTYATDALNTVPEMMSDRHNVPERVEYKLAVMVRRCLDNC